MIIAGQSQAVKGVRRAKNRSTVLEDATIREFGGGWNVVDNELNLSTRFATLLDNMSREEDGSMGARWGTQLLADTRDVQWFDPNDYTILPLTNHNSNAAYGGDPVSVIRPTFWYDGNTVANRANSTAANFEGIPNTPVGFLEVSGEFAAPTLVDTVWVSRPTDGWTNNTGHEYTLKIDVVVDGVQTTAREQSYVGNEGPENFIASSIFTENASGAKNKTIDAVIFTITITNVSKDGISQCGVAEVRAGIYEGAGENPSDVYIVNHTYFQDSIIVVMSNGIIIRVKGDGELEVIWDALIAQGLNGSPDPWGPTDFASFAVFNGDLIVCNGTDKPLIINFENTPPVQYLADPSTGANVNVPIARYVIAMNKYVIMAGDPLYPDRVWISGQNTAGVWFGDADTDATFVDLGKVGVQGEQIITGINRYRGQLVVAFYSASVLGQLGIYDNSTPPVHTPDFNDVIEGFGSHSHRSMVNLGNDLFMLDGQGIISIARSLYSGATEPKRVSELIDPAINANVNRLREIDTLNGAHAVYNSNDKQYMCFIPNYAEVAYPMMNDPFEVLQFDPTSLFVRIQDHSLLKGDRILLEGVKDFNTVDADASLNGLLHTVQRVIDDDIFMITPSQVPINTDPNASEIVGGDNTCEWTPQWTETIGYIYTFVNELKIRAWARYRNWRWRSSCRTELGNVVFADDLKLYVYGNQNFRVYSDFVNTENVTAIEYQWELPWADFDQRANEKHTRYIQLDTAGTSKFTLQMFVDQIYKIQGLLTPNVALEFTAGDQGGYGGGSQSYGAGRNTSDQRLYDWPSRGKLFKLRFQGETTEPLRVIAVTILYQNGSIRR